ncbi:MAG: 3-phosphoshikimate 1-carboxyvinyltransferase [Planctomycetes bacterium]|nr:3-phosphoshikimate 1-carboxyvinyltransferase [Planctomycetota bacterium]
MPGDKSITHRALLLAALAEGRSRIEGPLLAGDALATRGVLAGWGVEVTEGAPGSGGKVAWEVRGRGLRGLVAPQGPLDCGRSGTTLRLAAGIAAGQGHPVTLSGDPQLLARPMGRIRDPLRALGATVEGPGDAARAPLFIHGGALRGGAWTPEVASAQVKSCLLLAGLCAGVEVTVVERTPTRDHTERLLRHLGVELTVTAGADGAQRVALPAGAGPLPAFTLEVPGDPSSASFLWAWAALTPGGDVSVEDVALNPGRTGLLRVLARMGAQVECTPAGSRGGEPVGRVRVRGQALRAVEVGGAELVALVDEVPLLALLATQATGTTRVRDASDLRHKESDRLATTAAELGRLGAQVEVLPDGLRVRGPTPLHGAVVESHGDHRLAMTLATAGLVAHGATTVRGVACHRDSFPGFCERVAALGGRVDALEEAPC